MEDKKEVWIASVSTTDVQTQDRHRVAMYMKGFDVVLHFDRLEEIQGKKTYSNKAIIHINNLNNSGFENFFGICVAKIGAPRFDDQETRYSEAVKVHFDAAGDCRVIRFSYSIAPGQKTDYKRARLASLKIYQFTNYQEAKPYMVRQPNGSYDQLPESNCIYTLNLKLMPNINTTGTGGRNLSEGEGFLQNIHTMLNNIQSAIMYTRVINHITSEDSAYAAQNQAYNTAVNNVTQATQSTEGAGTNINHAAEDNSDDYPY
jgi:hypothetical protein